MQLTDTAQVSQLTIAPTANGSQLSSAGTIGTLQVAAPGAAIELIGGSVDSLSTAPTATESQLNVSGGQVNQLNLEAPATIGMTGGTINQLNVAAGASGSQVTVGDDAELGDTQLAEDTTIIVNDKEVTDKPSTPTPGGDTGGGYVPTPQPTVGAISITADPFDVSGLDNNAKVAITLSTSTADANIYYTLDGSTPTSKSTLYSDSFTVTAPGTSGGTVTVKAIGIKSGYTDSKVAEMEIVFKAAEEEPEPSTYTVTFNVTPADATVVVKDIDKNEVTAEENGTYKLEAGEYSYTVSAEGYVTKSDTFTVTDADQTVTVALEEDLVKAALAAVNAAADRDALKVVIEEKADTLALDLTNYNTLIDDRKPSVSSDLLSNKPDVEGYDLATLQTYFDAIVATRLVTQHSMNQANDAQTTVELDGRRHMLLDRFEAAKEIYTIHSGEALTGKVSLLQGLMDRYNKLGDKKTAVLDKVLALRASEYGGKFARSRYTTDAFKTALEAVEAEPERYTVSVTAENGTVEGTGTYAVGTEITLTATANENYQFHNWTYTDGNEISTDNSYIFIMGSEDVTIVAHFVKTEAAVLADVDTRINNAIPSLKVTDTGISDITYEERKATFLIKEPDTPIINFAGSGVIGLFQEMFTDVTNADIYIGEIQVGTIENPTEMTENELMSAIAQQLILPLVNNDQSNLGGSLSLLVGKSASAEMTISAGLVEYKATYTVEFVAETFTVSVIAENGSVDGAGTYAVGTPVTLTATPATDYVFDGWFSAENTEVSKANPYTFTMGSKGVTLTAKFNKTSIGVGGGGGGTK